MRAAILCMALLAPTTALAAEEINSASGTLPGDATFALDLQGGFMSTDTVLVDPANSGGPAVPTSLKGGLGILRWSFGSALRVTRFGSEIGVEGTIGLGGYQPAAVARQDVKVDGEGDALYLDMEFGLNGMLLRHFILDRETKLKVAGGVGFSSDTAYVYASGRVQMDLIPQSVAVEGQYTFRWGDSWSEATTKEHRLGGHLVFRKAHLDLGGEIWVGDQRLFQTDMTTGARVETPTGGRGMKGKYTVLMVSIGFRWF